MNTRPNDYGAAWSAWQQHEEKQAAPRQISLTPDWQAQCRAMAYRARLREARRIRIKNERIAWCLCAGIILAYLVMLFADDVAAAFRTYLNLPSMLFMGGVLTHILDSEAKPELEVKAGEVFTTAANRPVRPTFVVEYLGKCHAHGGKHRARSGEHTEYGDSPGEAIGKLAIRIHNEYGPFVIQIV